MALISNNISGSTSNASKIGVTGSVVFANVPAISFPMAGTDATFFVSGSNNGTARAVFGGEVVLSGTTYVGTAEAGSSLEVIGHGGIIMNPYGTGAGQTSEIRFEELAANGGNYVALKAPNSIAANVSFALPSADGSSNHVIKTDGAGNLSFTSVSTLAVGGSLDTQVLFNDGGSIAGDAGLTYNKTTDDLTVAGDLAVNGGDITTTAGTFNLVNAASIVNLGTTNVTRTVNIGVNNSNVQTVNVGTGTAANIVTIGSATGAATSTLNGGTSVTLGGVGGTNYSIGTSITTGIIEVGSTSHTGDITIGRSTDTNRINIGTGATSNTKVQYINIGNGTDGGSTGFADITIGSNVGGNGSTVIQAVGNVHLSGSSSTTYTIGKETTTGAITVGGATQTGTITIGRSNQTNTINIGSAGIAALNIQTINIGGGDAGSGTSNVNIGRTVGGGSSVILGGNTGAVHLSGSNSTTYTIGKESTTSTITIGGTSQTGTITLGQSTQTNTISIGAGNNVSNTQNINIGTGATGTGKSIVTVGSIGGDTVGTLTTIQAAATVILTGSTVTNYRIGGETGTGTITVGRSTQTNTIDIGNGNIATGATQTINIGAGEASSPNSITNVGIGSNSRNSNTIIRAGSAVAVPTAGLYLTGSADTNYYVGGETGTGTITIGRSTQTNTINIGNGNIVNAATQTINIGNGNIDSGATQTINIGAGAASAQTSITNVTIGANGQDSNTIIRAGYPFNVVTTGLYLTGSAYTDYYIGGETGIGTITIGRSSKSHLIDIGSTELDTNETQLISIAATSPSRSNVTTLINAGRFNASATCIDYTILRAGVASLGLYARAYPGEGGATLAGANIQLIGGAEVVLTGSADMTAYRIGGETTTGTITIGRSTKTNTINIGNGDIATGATQTINIGAGAASSLTSITNVTIGANGQDSNTIIRAGYDEAVPTAGLYLTGSTRTDYYIGGETGIGKITVGRSTSTNEISIGSANTTTGNTQTVKIGAGSPGGTGKAVIEIGNIFAASSVAISAGTGDITMSGIVKNASQPGFLVAQASQQSNITASTDVDVNFGTEIFDNGGNVGLSGARSTFTAPRDGKYLFNVTVRLDSVDIDADYYTLYLWTQNREYRLGIIDPLFSSDPVYFSLNGSVVADMDANDTAYVYVRQQGGANQTDIMQTISSVLNTFWSGWFLG